MSLKDKIRKVQDLRAEKLRIDEWDVELEIRAFSVRKRMDLRKIAMDSTGKEDSLEFVGNLLVESCYDPETGEKVFNQDDIEWLGDKSGPVLDGIIKKAMEVNGLNQASAVEAEKNSQETPS